MKKILISFGIVFVALAGLYLVFREPFDRYNPLIEEEYVYVEIDEDPVEADRRFEYRLQGVTEDGDTKRVVFSTSVELDHGTFVRVLAKGSYTSSYTIIDEDDMPSD